MIFPLWLAILSCCLLSLLCSSSASPSSLSLSLCLVLSLSSSACGSVAPPPLCFLSLSFPLLFSVFPLIHQLLTTFPSPSLPVSICAFPVCHLSLRFVFLPPVRRSAPFFSLFLALSLPCLRGHSPRREGLIGDKQFCFCCCSLSAPTGPGFGCVHLS